MAPFALLAASVLVPFPLYDSLLCLAEVGLFDPLWSDEILDEVNRALVDDIALDPARAHRRMDHMRATFRDALVSGYEHLIPSMANHPRDRHVLAAAIRSGADFLVTNNVRHVRPWAAIDHDIDAVTADEFLVSLCEEDRSLVRQTLVRQARRYRSPALSVADLLDRLACPMLTKTLSTGTSSDEP